MTTAAQKPGVLSPAPPPNEAGAAEHAVDPLIGKTINGRFIIQSLIARGGMGKIYKAEQSPLGRICALKVLNPKYDGDDDPEFQRRFFLEASIAAKLSHANTVTIFDYGREGDLYFIAMEYIEGRTLFHELRRTGPFSEQRVSVILAQICRSLREAHRLDVVHRDMKPANVLLQTGNDEDTVKVLDFGLVKDVSNEGEDLTQAGMFMGSPKYMAPEQILGHEVSPSTDIYSVGVMAYELLTGRVPFDKEGSVQTLMAHVNEPPPPFSECNPDVVVSEAMRSLVFRCLEKDPLDRFANMDQLLAALTTAKGGDALATSMPHGGPQMDLSGPQVAFSGSPSGSLPAVEFPSELSTSPSGSTVHSSATPEPFEQPAELSTRKSSRIAIIATAALAVICVVVILSMRGDKETKPVVAGPPGPPGEPTAATGVADRTIRVVTKPEGATVKQGAKVLCTPTPCYVTWRGEAASPQAEHSLTISLEGSQTEQVEVTGTESEVAVELRPASKKEPSDGKPKDTSSGRATPPPVTPPRGQPTKQDPSPGYKPSPY